MKAILITISIILLSSQAFGSFRLKRTSEEGVVKEVKIMKEIKTNNINNSYKIALMRRRDSGKNKMLLGGTVSAFYGFMAFPAANNQEAEGKDGNGSRVLGVGFLIFSGYLFYRYYSNDYYASIIPFDDKITLMLSKKF